MRLLTPMSNRQAASSTTPVRFPLLSAWLREHRLKLEDQEAF